jgi:prepilin-type N-terminal cleavage/methylation domain-containing protein
MRERGFTLVELVASLVIIAILAAVTAPRFFDNRPYAARGFADEVADSLRYAQMIARATSCETRFVVDGTGAYAVFQRNSGGGASCNPAGAWNSPVLRPDGTLLTGSTPRDLSAMAPTIVTFDGTGRLIGPAQSIAVETFSVSIDLVSGSVRVAP